LMMDSYCFNGDLPLFMWNYQKVMDYKPAICHRNSVGLLMGNAMDLWFTRLVGGNN
jgi:hypothetical protein